MEAWLSDSKDNRREASAVERAWELSQDYQPDFQPDVEAGLKKLKIRIAGEHNPKVVPMPHRRRWLHLVASILIILGAIWMVRHFSTPDRGLRYANTLEGQTHLVHLDDGSSVYLNQNSSLQFPGRFDGPERKVIFSGEAFFEITPDQQRPFIIETQDAEIKVLGTSFNVRAYPSENYTEVVVKTGEVAFIPGPLEQPIVLKARQKAGFDHQSDKIRPKTNSSLEEIAWRTPHFDFRNVKVGYMLERLEKEYEIKFHISDPKLLNCPAVNTTLTPNNLKSIIERIELAFNWKVTTTDNINYQISGISCS